MQYNSVCVRCGHFLTVNEDDHQCSPYPFTNQLEFERFPGSSSNTMFFEYEHSTNTIEDDTESNSSDTFSSEETSSMAENIDQSSLNNSIGSCMIHCPFYTYGCNETFSPLQKTEHCCQEKHIAAEIRFLCAVHLAHQSKKDHLAILPYTSDQNDLAFRENEEFKSLSEILTKLTDCFADISSTTSVNTSTSPQMADQYINYIFANLDRPKRNEKNENSYFHILQNNLRGMTDIDERLRYLNVFNEPVLNSISHLQSDVITFTSCSMIWTIRVAGQKIDHLIRNVSNHHDSPRCDLLSNGQFVWIRLSSNVTSDDHRFISFRVFINSNANSRFSGDVQLSLIDRSTDVASNRTDLSCRLTMSNSQSFVENLKFIETNDLLENTNRWIFDNQMVIVLQLRPQTIDMFSNISSTSFQKRC